ncbi:MAG: hypothetical protein FWG89_02370 [Treponema sp.]|nr:hypothetical protein [Treponema sp.]
MRDFLNILTGGSLSKWDVFWETTFPIIIIAVCIAGIIGIILYCVIKEYGKWAIILSTIISCVLMIPVISSINSLVEAGIIGKRADELDRVSREIRIKRQEIRIDELNIELENNRIAMEERSIEIETLSENITLLENGNLSVRNFNTIFEVALLQIDLNQTTVRKDRLNKVRRGWGINADYYFDEVLVVISHDIEAKFGIDLKNIMISKINENTVNISGITPTYMGASKNEPFRHIAETRRVNQKMSAERKPETVSSIIDHKIENIALANNRAHYHANQFQERLSQGVVLHFMGDAVIQLAENFLVYLFSPHFENIEFSSGVMPGAIPFLEYFETETNTLNNQRDRLRLENINITQRNSQLEDTIQELTQELEVMVQELNDMIQELDVISL